MNAKKTLVTIVILVVLAAAVMFAYLRLAPPPGQTAQNTAPSGSAATPALPSAPVEDMSAYGAPTQSSGIFPQEFILGTNIASVRYFSPTGTQVTAQWDTPSTPDTIISQYTTYLASHGWFVPPAPLNAGSEGLSAINASSSILLKILPVTGGSEVTVTYSHAQ